MVGWKDAKKIKLNAQKSDYSNPVEREGRLCRKRMCSSLRLVSGRRFIPIVDIQIFWGGKNNYRDDEDSEPVTDSRKKPRPGSRA
jgi:hypothetical protein